MGNYSGYIITGVENIDIGHTTARSNGIHLSIDTESEPDYYIISYEIDNLDTNMQTLFNNGRLGVALAHRTSEPSGPSYSCDNQNNKMRKHEKWYKWHKISVEHYEVGENSGGYLSDNWQPIRITDGSTTGAFWIAKDKYIFIDPSETFRYSHGGAVYRQQYIRVKLKVIFYTFVPGRTPTRVVNDAQEEIWFNCNYRKRQSGD